MFFTGMVIKGGIDKMTKKVTAYKVTNLSKVDKTLYKEGDIFITSRSVGILVNNDIKTIGNELPDLSQYVKRDELPDLSQYVKRDEVQQMIDDAINNEGGEGVE